MNKDKNSATNMYMVFAYTCQDGKNNGQRLCTGTTNLCKPILSLFFLNAL